MNLKFTLFTLTSVMLPCVACFSKLKWKFTIINQFIILLAVRLRLYESIIIYVPLNFRSSYHIWYHELFYHALILYAICSNGLQYMYQNISNPWTYYDGMVLLFIISARNHTGKMLFSKVTFHLWIEW